MSGAAWPRETWGGAPPGFVVGDAQNDAAEVRLTCERRIGELQKEAPKAKGARGGGKKEGSRGRYVRPRDETPTLAQKGLTKSDSERFQAMASLR